MKSLNIDSGNIALDDRIGHQVKIEYTGGIQKGRVQGRAHTVTVAYTSLSKKLQAIHRLGGKIINVSIPRLQVNLTEVVDKHSDTDYEFVLIPEDIAEIIQTHGQPLELQVVEVAEETIVQVEHDDSISPEVAVIITEDIVESAPEIIHEVPLEITDQIEIIELAIITEPVSENPEVISAQVLEIAPQKVDVIPENTSEVEEVTVVTPKKAKFSSAIASKSKSKKSPTSAKTKHGFNTKDVKTQTQELKTIADIVQSSHKVEELKPEQLSEPVSEVIVETAEKIEKSIELELSSIPKEISEQVESEQVEIVEPVAEIEKVIPETNLKPKSSSTKKSSAKAKKSKPATIADETLQVAEETVVETNIDLPIPEIATEDIAASTPEPSSTPKSLAKSKKSKTTNKSLNGFNKSKGDG